MEHRLGSLAVGKQANLLALTAGLNQQHIWVAGREILPPLPRSLSLKLVPTRVPRSPHVSDLVPRNA